MKKLISAVLAFSIALLTLSSCRVKTPSRDEETVDASKVSENIIFNNTELETDAGTKREPREPLVLIDAGHGFGDIGCSSKYIKNEAEITIDIAKRLESELKSLGINCMLTHDGESYISEKELSAECEKYNIEKYDPENVLDNGIFSAYERGLYEEVLRQKYGVNFFISIHVNSIEAADYVDGYELYYCTDNPHHGVAMYFAEQLRDDLDNDMRVEGYKTEDAYIVTKYANIPSVLFEVGYATNKADASKMNNSEWRASLARILAENIEELYKTDFHNQGL